MHTKILILQSPSNLFSARIEIEGGAIVFLFIAGFIGISSIIFDFFYE
jgi:hypothetical protein